MHLALGQLAHHVPQTPELGRKVEDAALQLLELLASSVALGLPLAVTGAIERVGGGDGRWCKEEEEKAAEESEEAQ